MAPEYGVSELPLTNDNISKSKEMESEDIEDGEILEDESNQGDEACEPAEIGDESHEEKNNFERFFAKEKKNHHHHHHHHHHRPHDHQESHKPFRRDRPPFPTGLKKRKHSDEDVYRSEKYYGKKNRRSDAEDELEEDMMFILGGPLHDVERKLKSSKKSIVPSAPEDVLDRMIYNEGENEDPRPYARRSPTERRNKLKKDRGLVRGVGSGLLKRRGGRGGPIIRKEKPRESANDVCLFFAQGKCQRGSDCPYLHAFNQPRKLEICKFYLNDCCTKRDKCIYMHSDFPCKYFHLPGLTCSLGAKCKFSHSKLDEVQRAVLKKYADVPIKEVDEMQRFYRETGNGAFSSRNNKEKKDSRIPSLFDIKVSVPPEFRGNEVQEGDGVTTPIPSPDSMVYENNDSDEKSHKHHHKHNKVLAEHNDYKHDFFGEEIEPTEQEVSSKRKKKSRKSDELSDGERSRKHGDKKKKKSKKDNKDGERGEKKKKKKDHKRNKSENLEDAFAVGNHTIHEDAFEVSADEKSEREPVDAFAHLPKKQQELFLRIQQHQKEANSSQNANVDEKNEEDDPKQDVNWYSSDEEETPQPAQESTSPLATLLRTIQTSSSSGSNVPSTENKTDSIPASTHLFLTPSTVPAENESVPIVDASQLANIDLSDEVTKILTSIMKTEAASTYSDTISNSLPSDSEKTNERLSSSTSVVRKPFPTSSTGRPPAVPMRKTSSEDISLPFRSSTLFGGSSSSSDTTPKDIDLRQLPFKPVPLHDAANEIDASITSHPPMDYKLKLLPSIPKVNYASMIDAARNCAKNDPRFFKKKVPIITAEQTIDPPVKPIDPRPEAPIRVDPRIRNDPRLAAGKNIPSTATVPVIPAVKVDPRMEKADFRDPRLVSCNKFPPEGSFPYQMAAVAAAAAAAAAVSLPQSVMPTMLSAKEPASLRKEDPRLRFRANQNV